THLMSFFLVCHPAASQRNSSPTSKLGPAEDALKRQVTQLRTVLRGSRNKKQALACLKLDVERPSYLKLTLFGVFSLIAGSAFTPLERRPWDFCLRARPGKLAREAFRRGSIPRI